MIRAMTRSITMQTALLSRHVIAAPVALVVSLLVVGALSYDRRAPLEFVNGEVLPANPAAGAQVRIRWHTDWHRACEGAVSREVVGSDKIVRAYDTYRLRIPTRLGVQVADTQFRLPKLVPVGTSTYRAVIRFADCGITSRIVPLALDVPDVEFEIAPPG